MTPADSRTHLNGTYLQRPPSFEPFGVHRLDQQRQELLQQTRASVKTESQNRINGNTNAHGQDIESRQNGNLQDSHQYQLNNGRLPRTGHRPKRYTEVVGGATKHECDLDDRSVASSGTSLGGRNTTEPHRDSHPSQSTHHSTGQPMTIRDIVDSQELRNKLSDLYNSMNSNPDPQPPQYTSSSAQAQGGISNQPSPNFLQAPLSGVQTDRNGPQRGLRDDGVANDLTMNISHLESSFRARLEAEIQVLEAPREHQHTNDNGRATASSNIRESDFRKLLPSERQRRELYSSSYSPSNFSSADEVEEEEEELDDNDNDEDEEEQNTVEHKGSDIPRITQTPPPPPPQPQPLQRPPNPTSTLNQRRVELNGRRNNSQAHDAGYESAGDLSFEREVAIARAKRELGASQDNGRVRPNGTVTKASRLDHGRDLVLEDLASPVRHDFGEDQGDQHSLRLGEQAAVTVGQGPRGRAEPHYPAMTAEERFIELAGSLGEGQAVASVLGTLKGMIRQLKLEKRSSMSAVRTLKKDLKQAQRELRRTCKANEKLSKAKSVPLTHRSGSKHDKDMKQDLENATPRSKRNQSQEEKEQERKNAVIQREKERAERDLRALQKQLDALEKQKETMQKKERLRAEEEADLLFLIESDGDDDEDEDDNVDTESESDSDSESEDESFRIQNGSVTSERNDRDTPLVDARARRDPKSKRRSPSKGTSTADGKDMSRYRTDSHRTRDRTRPTGQTTGSRSKSAHPDTRNQVDKVEEVHIHHHVYYNDADVDDVLNPRPRAINGAQPRLHHSTSRLDDRFSGQEDGLLANDAGFNFYRRGSTHPGQLEKPAARKSMLSRSFPGQRMHASQRFEATAEEVNPSLLPPPRRHQTHPHMVNWEGHGNGQQSLGSDVPAHKDGEAYPLYRQGPQVISTTQGSTRMVTRVQHGFGLRSAGTHGLTIPLKNSSSQRKKISIDLQRILSLLKKHDPRRCTVCCNGGDGRDHSTHHDHHHHLQSDQQQRQQERPSLMIDGKPVLIRHKSVVTTRSTVQRSSPSPLGKGDGGYRDAVSDSESSVSSMSDGEARTRRTARDEASDYGAGVGSSSYPTRRGSQSQPPRTTETDIVETNNDGGGDDNDDEEHGHPPEWKLHVTLCKLDKEVQQLRKSHLDLSGKLERLGNSSNMPAPTAAGGDTGVTSMASSARQDDNLEEVERKRQQRRQLRLQLQRVVDSLEEKADEILGLQHYLLEQQQQQHEDEKGERREQREAVDAVSESSGGSRLKRAVRKFSTVEDAEDVEEEDFASRQKESGGGKQVSGGRGLKVPERYKHRTVNGAHVS
ncbi:hypothetical protein BGX24_000508 [Mortierella sp. AD032]|nr:hypothetical protein BGX24_000508 [Mortierella sp. AD032]